MLGSGPNRLWLGNRRFICSLNELAIRKWAPCTPPSSLTTFYLQHRLFYFPFPCWKSKLPQSRWLANAASMSAFVHRGWSLTSRPTITGWFVVFSVTSAALDSESEREKQRVCSSLPVRTDRFQSQSQRKQPGDLWKWSRPISRALAFNLNVASQRPYCVMNSHTLASKKQHRVWIRILIQVLENWVVLRIIKRSGTQTVTLFPQAGLSDAAELLATLNRLFVVH